MIVKHRTFLAGFFALYAALSLPIYVTPSAYATRVVDCIEGQFKYTLLDSIPYPATTAQAKTLIARLQKSIYAPNVKGMMARVESLSSEEREDLWAMVNKLQMNHAENTPASQLASRRITINTNQRRRAQQMGGKDESPDPSPPFKLTSDIKRPEGMPDGVYQLSSGKNAFYFETLEHHQLKNKDGQPVEIVYQQQTKDGKWVTQTGGYAAADSSHGWDGRPEIQPDGKGGHELVITQGAMELPVNRRGASEGARELPYVAEDNPTRSRHVFELHQWIPASKGKPAQLVVRDRGSILNMEPSDDRRWIEIDESGKILPHSPDESGSYIGKLLHAHGYGENFVPDPKDPRKMYVDPDGYTWRIFDMVTAETKIRNPDGTFKYIPTETRAVAYRMDPKNPSKVVPAGVLLPNGKPANAPVFFTSNHFPGTNVPIPATIRYAYDTRGHAVEKRMLQEDGTVKVITKNVPQGEPALLNEGLNLVPGVVQIGKKRYFLGTNSGGEYTSGQPLPGSKEDTQYGAYLWFREEHEGPVGAYHPVLTADGKNLEDQLRDLRQMYLFSWGPGRAQAFKEEVAHADAAKSGAAKGVSTKGVSEDEGDFDIVNENGRWWLKLHAVDVHRVKNGLPKAGYVGQPMFNDGFRRHQMTIPISFVEKNGLPSIEIDDPKFAKDLEEWRKRKAAAQRQ